MKTSKTDPIRVDFLNSKEYPDLNRLGMTFAPGKKERYGIGGHWNRDLAQDLGRLKEHYRIDTLISLVEDAELRLLGIEDLPSACKSEAIELVRFTIKDLSTPTPDAGFTRFIADIGDSLNEGRTVAVHCRAGLGRTGLLAACTIVAVSGGNIDGKRAVEMVRCARSGTVETVEQEKFVIDFADRRRAPEDLGAG